MKLWQTFSSSHYSKGLVPKLRLLNRHFKPDRSSRRFFLPAQDVESFFAIIFFSILALKIFYTARTFLIFFLHHFIRLTIILNHVIFCQKFKYVARNCFVRKGSIWIQKRFWKELLLRLLKLRKLKPAEGHLINFIYYFHCFLNRSILFSCSFNSFIVSKKKNKRFCQEHRQLITIFLIISNFYYVSIRRFP